MQMRGKRYFLRYNSDMNISPTRCAGALSWASTCALLLAISGTNVSVKAARADVAWHHSISVRVGQNLKPWTKPQAKFTLLNQWSEGRQRTVVRIKSSDLAGMQMPPLQLPDGKSDINMTWAPIARPMLKAPSAQTEAPGAVIEVGAITNFADDSFTLYTSPNRSYVKEPLTSTYKRVRFDPWKKLAPRLSEEPIEPLTTHQRARLGAEVRAAYTPFIKDNFKAYFHALGERRTFNGMDARGYRMAWLINTGDKQNPAWARVKTEWWIGDSAEGDELIRDLMKRSQEFMREMGGPTQSMWLNEFYPVWYQMLPQQIHQSVETLMPRMGQPNAGFAGTPLRMYLTVVPPPVLRSQGELRADMELISRSTSPLPESAFGVPRNYKRVPLGPELDKYDKLMQQVATRYQKTPLMGWMP